MIIISQINKQSVWDVIGVRLIWVEEDRIYSKILIAVQESNWRNIWHKVWITE